MSSVIYVGDALKMVLDAVRSTLPESEQERLNSLTKFVDQLPSVMNEVLVNCWLEIILCYLFHLCKC